MEGVQNVAFSSFSDPIMLSSNFLGALEEEFRQMFWVRVFEALRRAMVAMAWSIYLCTRQALNFLALNAIEKKRWSSTKVEWHIMVTHHIKESLTEHSLPTPWWCDPMKPVNLLEFLSFCTDIFIRFYFYLSGFHS